MNDIMTKHDAVTTKIEHPRMSWKKDAPRPDRLLHEVLLPLMAAGSDDVIDEALTALHRLGGFERLNHGGLRRRCAAQGICFDGKPVIPVPCRAWRIDNQQFRQRWLTWAAQGRDWRDVEHAESLGISPQHYVLYRFSRGYLTFAEKDQLGLVSRRHDDGRVEARTLETCLRRKSARHPTGRWDELLLPEPWRALFPECRRIADLPWSDDNVVPIRPSRDDEVQRLRRVIEEQRAVIETLTSEINDYRGSCGRLIANYLNWIETLPGTPRERRLIKDRHYHEAAESYRNSRQVALQEQ